MSEPEALPASESQAEFAPCGKAPLWPSEPVRNGVRRCGVCNRENHETRAWCTACGHQMGVARSECVCERCVRRGGGDERA